MIILAPCPFCSGNAEFDRIGTGRVSCIIKCTACNCTLESNESSEHCGKQWNDRPELMLPDELTQDKMDAAGRWFFLKYSDASGVEKRKMNSDIMCWYDTIRRVLLGTVK